MSSAPNSHLPASSGAGRDQAAWYIVAVAAMSFVLAILLAMSIRSAIAHDHVYAGLMLIIGPLLLLSIIVNARRILRAIP